MDDRMAPYYNILKQSSSKANSLVLCGVTGYHQDNIDLEAVAELAEMAEQEEMRRAEMGLDEVEEVGQIGTGWTSRLEGVLVYRLE